MKKFLRITAALAAVFAMVNFVACKDDDDDGDDGNGFENTYWVVEDVVYGSSDAYTLTASAVSYVHIKDGTNGSTYEMDNAKAKTEIAALFTAGVTASKDIPYSETEILNFTYAIEGSSIKITYKDEAGKDVNVTVTVAEDKTSFSLTDKDEETGEEYTMTYKKVAAAPKAATVTYTVKTTGETPVEPTEPETPAEPVTYSFESGISAEDVNSVGLVYDTAKKVYNTPVAAELTEKVLTSGATIGWKSSKAGTLRFRAASEDPAGVTALNYNGGSADDISASCGTPDRYVKVPVKAGQTITVTYKVVASSSLTEEALGQIGLFDDSNAAVGTVTADLKLKSDDGSKKTLTATAAADGNVKVVFSRKGATGGGVDIYSIVVE